MTVNALHSLLSHAALAPYLVILPIWLYFDYIGRKRNSEQTERAGRNAFETEALRALLFTVGLAWLCAFVMYSFVHPGLPSESSGTSSRAALLGGRHEAAAGLYLAACSLLFLLVIFINLPSAALNSGPAWLRNLVERPTRLLTVSGLVYLTGLVLLVVTAHAGGRLTHAF